MTDDYQGWDRGQRVAFFFLTGVMAFCRSSSVASGAVISLNYICLGDRLTSLTGRWLPLNLTKNVELLHLVWFAAANPRAR